MDSGIDSCGADIGGKQSKGFIKPESDSAIREKKECKKGGKQ